MVELGPTWEQVSRLFQRGSLVKICGLRQPEHAAAAAAAGADLIGFIFAPARRQVSAATARLCIGAAREVVAGRKVLAGGVIVDATSSEIARIVHDSGIDAVQLHGAEPPDSTQGISVPAIKAVRPHQESTVTEVLSDIQSYRSAATPPVGFLIDGYSATASGGTGTPVDWDLATQIVARCPVLLAGGLNPENVGAAIRYVRPLGVDVSSGVETNGIKDVDRIAMFVRSARTALEEVER